MMNPRQARGPTSPRGIASKARAKMKHAEKYAPGMSLDMPDTKMNMGGKVKKYRKGGSIDGCAKKGKTRGKIV
jgi:hypothetical protein